MFVANRVVAQSEEAGAAPTVYAATEDLPGNTYIGPDGFMEQRGKPTIVGRTDAAKDEDKAARPVGALRAAHRSGLSTGCGGTGVANSAAVPSMTGSRGGSSS